LLLLLLLLLVKSSNEQIKIEDLLKIAKLLEDLIETESNCAKIQFEPRNQTAIDDFIEFIKSNDTSNVDFFEIKNVNQNELGLFTTKNYEKDDLLIEIPKSLMITLENALESPLGKTSS
jgi:type III secretory pathway component EscR